MKVLELEEASEMCQNLTTEYSKPNCSQSICKQSDPYRTIDGCCNNLDSPTFGILIEKKYPSSFPFLGVPQTAFLRLLKPAYFDQVGLPRGGLTNSNLPNARAVSVAVHQAHKETHHRESISQMVMQFGQGGIFNLIDFDPQSFFLFTSYIDLELKQFKLKALLIVFEP